MWATIIIAEWFTRIMGSTAGNVYRTIVAVVSCSSLLYGSWLGEAEFLTGGRPPGPPPRWRWRCSASSQKAPLMRSMCRVLIKKTSSVYDENSQFACPAHANCFGTSSMSLVQRQRRCNCRKYRAETAEQRDGGWRNEDAVVQQLERPMYTAQTDNPVHGHASTCTPSAQACV